MAAQYLSFNVVAFHCMINDMIVSMDSIPKAMCMNRRYKNKFQPE